jgi:SAM-dependent methyltransferase
LLERTDLFDGRGKTVLHVAPERCLRRRLARRLGAGYLTADQSHKAMIRLDVTDIQFPDESFDVILCSHVLEHVKDDRKAMREFRRTLKRDGWAVLLVPITAERTFEDPSVTDPAERRRLFGQEDHVRVYGPDYADRLREAGFQVEATRISDLASPSRAERMGLTAAAGEMHFCRRT